MLKTIRAPGMYVQGYNVIDEFASYASKFGKRPFIIGGKTAVSRVEKRMLPGINTHDLKCNFSVFTGRGTKKDALELASSALNHSADVIVGVGGGLAIDTAKAVSHRTDLPLIIIPTVASTDAPCSSVALQYTQDNIIDEIIQLKRNPDIVIVDTKIITEAPVRYFVAGMGDALSTWFEANTCDRTGAKNLAGARPALAGKAIARLTYDTIMEYGESAKMAVELKAVTPAVEMVIEANCYLSSIGFENCGLGAAHSFGIGVGSLRGTEKQLHGELVGFGVIADLLIENYPFNEIEKIINFCIAVGLPVTLKELGVDDMSRDNILSAGRACFGPGSNLKNLSFDISEELAADIILAADALGRRYKNIE
ncbi:MAG: glycerol dehydrogenase [Deltaproteobacteria bacterium]|nr:glycerol dehydrogenase [Deltaproteobacteria bacterium]